MWCLVSQNDSRILYILSQNKSLTVGRIVDPQIDNFIAIEDASISRKHANLSILQNNLYLEDLGSRYGTYVNESGEKIGISSKVHLSHNDVVKFGKLNSIWTVQQINHVTCTSTLKGENLQNLKIVLEKLGGTITNDWDKTCTHLTMPAITLTIKVVLALIQGSYIVSTQYWNECLNAVSNNRVLPDPKNFTPHIIETTINKENVSFLPDERRSKMFTGKKFIFFSRRQLEMYKMVLLNSSATALLLSESKMTKSMLCSPEVVVISYNIVNTSQESQAQRNQINDIVTYLHSKGRRAVADAEIGLAILYCSTDKYCNPEFSFTSEVFKQPPPSSSANAIILAGETQETTPKNHLKKENVTINETLTPKNNILDTAGSAKRKLTEEISENVMNMNKKIAIGTSAQNNPTPLDNVKRKLCDEDAQMNPCKKIAIDKGETNENNIFNFVDSNNDRPSKITEKKLNLFKPSKRMVNAATNDEDLFNFVQETSSTKQTSIKKMFDISNTQINKRMVENLDSSISSNNQPNSETVKDDLETEELHSIMRDLDLGSTIIKVRKDLIVKKEMLKIEEQNVGENFKKFKKVWPVKMQVTIIPKTSMNVIKPEGYDPNEVSALVMSDDE